MYGKRGNFEFMEQSIVYCNIRIPEDLWERLRVISKKEKRSMNSQIVYIIQEFIEQTEVQNKEKEIVRVK